MSKETYLDEVSDTLRLMVHQTATCHHSLSAATYGPHKPPESGKSSKSWCSVDSLSHAGLLFATLKSIGGDHSHSYHSHLYLYLVSMCVVHSLALAGQLVQMSAAVHSIPKISQLLLHDLWLQNLDLSCPLWVWLWIQRDFMNAGIWTAFLCIHHCPFQHKCWIYLNDPQKTSLATTSND